MEARGMLTFLNNGGTVNYASNGVGVTDTQIGYFAGLRVVVDDQVPTVDPGSSTSGDHLRYTCYLAAPGVIRTGSQFPLSIKQNVRLTPVSPRRDVCDVNCMITSLARPGRGDIQHQENSDLADASNWDLASLIENVPLIELIVNTPYGQINT